MSSFHVRLEKRISWRHSEDSWYPNGRTETRYATGRVRVKDRDGRVLVDSSSQNRWQSLQLGIDERKQQNDIPRQLDGCHYLSTAPKDEK